MDATRSLGPQLLMVGLLGIGLLASPVPSRAEGPDGQWTITLPRQPAPDEAIVLRLTVGVLPRNARVVVRTLGGEIAGTVAPFGVRPGAKAGVYTIPIPASAVVGDKVSFRLEVLEKDARTARIPIRSEIEEARIAFVRVSPRPEEPKP